MVPSVPLSLMTEAYNWSKSIKPSQSDPVHKIRFGTEETKRSEFCRILDFEVNSRKIIAIDQMLNFIHKSADHCRITKQCKLSGKVMTGPPWFDANCKDSKKQLLKPYAN